MASPRWIARKVCAVAGAALALAALAAPVQACRGSQFHLTILLGAIPPAAEDSEVIAKVEIVDVQTRQPPGQRAFPVARARVLRAFRGTADGHIVEISAEGTSCGGGLGRDVVGREGFIAGRFVQFANGTLFSSECGTKLGSVLFPVFGRRKPGHGGACLGTTTTHLGTIAPL